jgi:predicted HTH transcriptional regulator
MNRDPLVEYELAKKILTFLQKNSGHSYTVQELVNERAISSSTQKIQQGIEELLKQGLVKVKSKGSELSYQIVPVQKK